MSSVFVCQPHWERFTSEFTRGGYDIFVDLSRATIGIDTRIDSDVCAKYVIDEHGTRHGKIHITKEEYTELEMKYNIEVRTTIVDGWILTRLSFDRKNSDELEVKEQETK